MENKEKAFSIGKIIQIRIWDGFGFNQFSGSVFWIRIRIQEGKNYPQKAKKNPRNFMFSSAGCSLLKAEGWLPVLYGCLGIGKLQFLIQKLLIFFSSKFLFYFRSSNLKSGLDPDQMNTVRIRNTGKINVLDSYLPNTDPDPLLNTDPVRIRIQTGFGSRPDSDPVPIRIQTGFGSRPRFIMAKFVLKN